MLAISLNKIAWNKLKFPERYINNRSNRKITLPSTVKRQELSNSYDLNSFPNFRVTDPLRGIYDF